MEVDVQQPNSCQHPESSVLLHGNLEIWVRRAANLPNMDLFSHTLHKMVSGKSDITSDPYVTFSADHGVLGRTYVKPNSENPEWDQHFYIPVALRTVGITFTVKDDDYIGFDLIGTVRIPARQIVSGDKIEGEFPVLGADGKPCKEGAALCLSVQYIPVESLSTFHVGVEPGPEYEGVPGTYFPLRKGGHVRLYQDAHVPDGCLPDVRTEGGGSYEHGKCWHDICEAIREARHLIYITGWSVACEVRLVRDHGDSDTLGDLLKCKSEGGVRVLLLVWDDPTSHRLLTKLGIQKDGKMQTGDEETRRFFKHSNVHALLCPRFAGEKHSLVQRGRAGLIYTHHQKTVIVDTDAGNNKRKITAFVGGLDLCKGRYDTPTHPLFSSLQTVHKDDFYNPSLPGSDVGGPRQPWHDLHSRIDGPAAYDVLGNFEERWRKASKPRGLDRLRSKHIDAVDLLVRLDRFPEIIRINESHHSDDNDPETWHVQIFRSIDSNSAKGFPKDPLDAHEKDGHPTSPEKEAGSKTTIYIPQLNLLSGKNVTIDASIHTAYVKAIRSAQRFIYIENQYFLGSSYNWCSFRDRGADNLLPMEIALKIASKIKARERFSVYIVIPMWPEGSTTGFSTRQILGMQNFTMQMMYQTVNDALAEEGLQNDYKPQDYLNFFCLGNREVKDANAAASSTKDSDIPNIPSRKNRRFMIYVHSKGMIVDDEYVIIGSANINQRSLEGNRDTEIAMGAYQPHQVWTRNPHGRGPRGQIHGYRISLWAEHLGVVEECFMHPESLECVQRVRTLAEQNWQVFTADAVLEMAGHLLRYPVEVDSGGNVNPLPGWETFLDVGGEICGERELKDLELII